MRSSAQPRCAEIAGGTPMTAAPAVRPSWCRPDATCNGCLICLQSLGITPPGACADQPQSCTAVGRTRSMAQLPSSAGRGRVRCGRLPKTHLPGLNHPPSYLQSSAIACRLDFILGRRRQGRTQIALFYVALRRIDSAQELNEYASFQCHRIGQCFLNACYLSHRFSHSLT